MEIAEVLRKGNLSHRDIAARFNRAQSTISKIARDAGITPTHRRRRTPAASHDLEITYDKQERINFQDRFIGVLDGMITDGGLSPREAREVAQASKVVFDARRAEDIEQPDTPRPDEREHAAKALAGVNLEEEFKWLDAEIARERLERQGHPGEEYGSGARGR
jgi:hypothetical protein